MNRFMSCLSITTLFVASLVAIQTFAQTSDSDPGSAPLPSASHTPSAMPPSTPSTTGMGMVTLQTYTGPMGEYLTDGQNKSLYVFAADSPGVSNCTGSCAQVWTPVTVSGSQNAKATGNAKSNLVGTITRNDGTTQLTYRGMPLYYYTNDRNPGDTNGEGIMSFGATWYLVKPDGAILMPVSSTNPSTMPSSTPSSTVNG